jgi:hypothetical protein
MLFRGGHLAEDLQPLVRGPYAALPAHGQQGIDAALDLFWTDGHAGILRMQTIPT